MSIKQSLLAQYIRGIKKLSDKRAKAIIKTIQEIGKELISVTI
mgnify:CR=1